MPRKPKPVSTREEAAKIIHQLLPTIWEIARKHQLLICISTGRQSHFVIADPPDVILEQPPPEQPPPPEAFNPEG